MTARDDLAALIGTPTRGLCPRSCRDTRDGPHVHNTLDRVASLATNPETAPVVFAWLVEAGVLEGGSTPQKASPVDHSCEFCDINFWHPRCPRNAEDAVRDRCPHCGSDPEDYTMHADGCITLYTCASTMPTLPQPWHSEAEWLQGERWTTERWRQHLAEAHS